MAANVNNYIAAANAAVSKNVRIRKALADNKPNYANLANASVNQAARNRANVAANNASTAETAIRGKTLVEGQKIKADTEKDIRDIDRKARMTGRLAGGAALLGIGAIEMNKEEEPDARLELLQQQNDYWRNRYEQAGKDVDEAGARYDALTEQMNKGGKSGKSSGENSSSSTSQLSGINTGSKPKGGNKTGLRLVNDLVGKGYSPVSAAAIAGNAQYESDNFTAYEEYSPNSYGTRGAGFLQWTNAGGANRRDSFESWAKSNNLDPASYEASAGYIDAEMKGGNNWTGGQSLEGFKGITDLNEATANYMNTYLRPAKDTANLSTRQSNASSLLQAYQDSLK